MVAGARVKVSNPDRVVFPDAGWTKETVVAHYATVSEAMLPHLGGAPLTLERYPQGLGSDGFMQKNAGRHYPESIERFEVPRKDGSTVYPVLHDARQDCLHVLGDDVATVVDQSPGAGRLEQRKRAARREPEGIVPAVARMRHESLHVVHERLAHLNLVDGLLDFRELLSAEHRLQVAQ